MFLINDIIWRAGANWALIVLLKHHHFMCPIIQQYAHLREYDSRRAGQQGPIRTLSATLKRSTKTVTGYIFYHTNKNVFNYFVASTQCLQDLLFLS